MFNWIEFFTKPRGRAAERECEIMNGSAKRKLMPASEAKEQSDLNIEKSITVRQSWNREAIFNDIERAISKGESCIKFDKELHDPLIKELKDLGYTIVGRHIGWGREQEQKSLPGHMPFCDCPGCMELN